MQTDKKNEKLMHELQLLEHNIQHLIMEKQALEIEFNEAETALSEVKKTSDEVYQIMGNIMLKAKKESLIKELEERKKLSELRIKSIENHEKTLQDKSVSLRKEITYSVSDKK